MMCREQEDSIHSLKALRIKDMQIGNYVIEYNLLNTNFDVVRALAETETLAWKWSDRG